MTLISTISARGTTTERLYLKDGIRILNHGQQGMICELQVKSYYVMFLFLFGDIL